MRGRNVRGFRAIFCVWRFRADAPPYRDDAWKRPHRLWNSACCPNGSSRAVRLRNTSSLRRPTHGRQPLPTALRLGRRKARYPVARFLSPPVEHRTCGFDRIRRSLRGHSPGLSRSICFHFRGFHRRSSMFDPIHQPTLAVLRGHSLRVRWVLCSPRTFVLRTSPGEGPSPSSSSWCTWLSHAPTTLPHPTACWALASSLGSPLPTLHPPSHPLQALPCAAWRTQAQCCRWRVAHCPVRTVRLPRGDTG